MKQLKQYWWAVVIVFGMGGWGTALEMATASGKAKDAEHDQILKEQHEIQMQQRALLEKLDGKMDVIMLLLGVKDTDSLAMRWKALPKSPPLSARGVPKEGGEWLLISNDYLLGRLMKWTDGDSVMVRIEWDERKE